MRGGLWAVTEDMTAVLVMVRGVEEFVTWLGTVVKGVLAAVREVEGLVAWLITVVKGVLTAVRDVEERVVWLSTGVKCGAWKKGAEVNLKQAILLHIIQRKVLRFAKVWPPCLLFGVTQVQEVKQLQVQYVTHKRLLAFCTGIEAGCDQTDQRRSEKRVWLCVILDFLCSLLHGFLTKCEPPVTNHQ